MSHCSFDLHFSREVPFNGYFWLMGFGLVFYFYLWDLQRVLNSL